MTTKWTYETAWRRAFARSVMPTWAHRALAGAWGPRCEYAIRAHTRLLDTKENT